jgi:hypothetical protein
VCDGCCIALSTSWSADLSGFALTNQNFTGCTDVDGVYILDGIGSCAFQTTRRLGQYEYSEPDLSATHCESRNIAGVGCFAPWIEVNFLVFKDNQTNICTATLDVAINWLQTGRGPCEICQRHYIARYKATSSTIDDLCNGSVVLNYIGKDPNICVGNPPATVTVTGL